ncbi:type IV pilin [Halomicrococcus sp. SG-WS-1]|uniref:type IV pilin n=1 Tax=Halomicrococcus sp. SG-WS-1 TaxID=3439057 RepID=UPI003F797CDB
MTLKEKFEAITGRDFDRAVSPVIGVILMVAITVILAAVIGTFVMGMGSNVENNVNAGASISVNNSTTDGGVTVTWVSKGSASKLNVKVKKGSDSASEPLTSVGSSVTIKENADVELTASNHNTVQVIVTAVGENGEKKTVINNEEHTI